MTVEKNCVIYHLHSDNSNGTMMDASTKYIDYILKAKEYGMKAIAFSEHGNVFNWILKKMDCDKHKIKYIHGMEAYITTTLEEKVREAFHLGIYAKNYEGVKEINRLSSSSFNKEDNHYYYRPRLSLDEVMNTSDNIIITSACLGSLLNKEGNKFADKLNEFMAKNKHRCFYEIQYHTDPHQVSFNKHLYELSKKSGVPLIAGTDTHALDEKKAKLRLVLQKSKGIVFTNEDVYDLTFKSYDELVKMFEIQDSLPMDVVLEAIENTNKFANMVEDFKLDLTHKYPKVSDNAEKEFKSRLNQGIIDRKVNKYPPEKRKIYYDRMVEEYEVMKGMGNIDYFILLDDIKKFCKSKKIAISPRGSCNGSLLLWVLGVTDIDSIRFGLPFFRFLNPSRVSLADVDIDMSGKRRDEVKDFLANYPDVNGSAIITFQTFQWKGATKAIGRGLGIPLEIVETISADIEEIEEENEETGEMEKITTFHNKEKWMELYPEFIGLVESAIGLIENVSVHACGFVVSNRNLDEELGTFRTDNSKWVISQNNMKAVDAANFVKMDLLIVDMVQIVEDASELAGVKNFGNDDVNFEDNEVWIEMLKSGLGIFQFEKTGWHYLKQALSNFDEFKKNSEGISRLDMMTALNGIIRPAGESIRDNFVKGIPHDNGMVEVNSFLGKTLGYLIYQEQIMLWLNNFCDYNMTESDNVRRAISKKGGTDHLLVPIKKAFMEYCQKTFTYSEDHLSDVVDDNLKVIKSASDYGFSENHSRPYSILGFKGAYLRRYHPLEFLTTQLIVNEGKKEKTTKIMEFVKTHTNIKLLPIKFRKSQSSYQLSKEDNAIYKGIKSIKELSDIVADELFRIGENIYETFVDLLIDVAQNTKINKTQLKILTKLNYFSEFGQNGILLKIYDTFWEGENQYKKTYVEKTKYKRVELLKLEEIKIRNNTPKKEATVPAPEMVLFQREYLGYSDVVYPYMKDEYVVVIEINTEFKPRLLCYDMRTGLDITYKIDKKRFFDNNYDPLVSVGDLLKLTKITSTPRKKKVNGDWIELKEHEFHIENWVKIITKKDDDNVQQQT